MSAIRPDWPAHARVHALVTTRATGDMAQAAGRDHMRRLLPGDPVWMRQVHGIAVLDADEAKRGEATPSADAAVSRMDGTVCAVMIADCMPIFFSDEAGSTVAVAHAGWRGLCGGVLEATVRAIGPRPSSLLAWLGPAIGPRVYEVGAEVKEAFVSRDRRAESAFIATRPGHWLLDLYAIARQRLEQSGVGQISGGGFCTYSERERFYSYRRERTAERMAALIWLA